MKTVLSVMLVLALVPLAACAPKVNDPADIQAVKQTVENFAKAMNAGDADAEVAMMTDKTIYADNHFPVAVGKLAVQAMTAPQHRLFKTEFQAPVEEVRVAGDLAVARGTWAINLTPKADGMAPISDSGSWILAASRQADKSWKWDWIVPNSDQPMPGTTADGAEEQAIMQLERDWVAAMVKRDTASLDRYLGKEWMFANDGQVTPRAEFLAEFKSGASRFESLVLHDVSVHVFGDVAVATMIGDLKGTYKGADISGSSRGTDFFVKRDGRWQAVSSQNTSIKK
jgi:ketosteroid isomerase-like protein